MAKKFSKSGVKFEGIRKKKSKWVAEIKDPFKQRAKARDSRIWLGTFETPEEASKVYQLKKMEFDALLEAENSIKDGDGISINGFLGDQETQEALVVNVGLEKVVSTIGKVEDSDENDMGLLGDEETPAENKVMDVDAGLEEVANTRKIAECHVGEINVDVLARFGSSLIDNYGRILGEFFWIEDLSLHI